jgi:E3 ubiquitin-protein ligase RNF115/126/E3 ubiquitin-protein ligase RNF38/44
MSDPAPAGAAPETAPVELTEFFCYECESSVSLPAVAGQRPLCPLCRGYFLQPSPFPELDERPPPLSAIPSVSGSEDSEGPSEFDELHDFEFMNPALARLYISRFIQDRLNPIAAPEDVDAATAAALSLLDEQQPDGEPPAPYASIAVLPTVLVSDPATDCAVCLEDLPLASVALKLPCSHLFHSVCITAWLQRHNSCPLCRFRLPVSDPVEDSLPEQDVPTTITIRLTTTGRPRVRINDVTMFTEAPISESPTQLAQAVNGEGGGEPANSGETVSSEWPPQPDSDTVMSEARDSDGFFD